MFNPVHRVQESCHHTNALFVPALINPDTKAHAVYIFKQRGITFFCDQPARGGSIAMLQKRKTVILFITSRFSENLERIKIAVAAYFIHLAACRTTCLRQ